VKPRGLTLVELLIALLILAILLLIVLPALVQSREASLRAACATNLKQMAIAMKMYAYDDPHEMWPPVSFMPRYGDPGSPGNWNVDGSFSPCARCLYPQYVADVSVLLCPTDFVTRKEQESSYLESWVDENGIVDVGRLEREGDVSYQYLGWAIWSNDYLHDGTGDSTEVLAAIAEALDYAKTHMKTDAFPPDQDIVFPDGHPNPDVRFGRFPRLTDARVPRGFPVLITDPDPSHGIPSQSEIAVMWDKIRPDRSGFNHSPRGSNVLFADGHVEFVQYPGEFPMSDLFAKVAALREGEP
jgi:prepilin-type N-terminal cleavage/methylation domain-containing protein/prepilin-type processing-associated H-X9-DG protein